MQFQNPIVLTADTAAGTARKVGFSPPVGERYRVKAIEICPNGTTAANGTNYASLRCYSGANALTAARTTASSALTELTPEAMAITAGLSNCEITSTSPFSIQVSHAASGAAVDVTVTVTVERINNAL